MNRTVTALALLWILTSSFTGHPEPWTPNEVKRTLQVSHQVWNELLDKHVGLDGNVDYPGFLRDKPVLARYLHQLARTPPGNEAGRNEKLAYYINLYNAATVMLILEHYPVQSIKNINKPWERAWIKVGENTLSLGHIEHEILRKLGEPRIHFAINCASFSCPKLRNKAFTAEGLEKELDQATRDFIDDPSRNKISKDAIELSRIFQWYKKDFTAEGSLINFINPFSSIKINPTAKISYQTYNWNLNEAR